MFGKPAPACRLLLPARRPGNGWQRSSSAPAAPAAPAGSLHLTKPEELQGLLAAHPPQHWQRTALIFHCEFSTERGPRAAKFVRNRVRSPAAAE